MSRLPQPRAGLPRAPFSRAHGRPPFSLSDPGPPRDGALTAALRESLKGLREKRLKILIIDDENGYRASMKFLLETVCMAEVVDVGSGPEGLARVGGGNAYDIVFLDLMMPGMGGNETYAELLKLAPSLPVVFMSAYSSSREWEQAKNSGVPLLHKPIPIEELVRILSQCGGRGHDG
jgi:CheY-like chemotaxis protein